MSHFTSLTRDEFDQRIVQARPALGRTWTAPCHHRAHGRTVAVTALLLLSWALPQSATATTVPEPLPDLIEDAFVVHDQPPSGGGCIQRTPTVEVCIANIGSAPAGPFTVSNGDGVGRYDFMHVTGLGAGQRLCQQVSVPWDVTLHIVVDPLNEVAESDEENNTRSEFVAVATLPPTCIPTSDALQPTPTPTPIAACSPGCNGQPCGPPCADGSPMAICATAGGVCGCYALGCSPSVCAQCSCSGDRDGDGEVTIDEIIAAVNYALSGCPPPPVLRWFPACGPPLSGLDICPPSVQVCTTEQVGALCNQPGSTCCEPGSLCAGSWCNAPLVCSTQSPDICPISRRQYKRDIEYLRSADLERLYDELRAIKLTTFRYKTEAACTQPHLGFIIDDIEPSFSVDRTGDRVDLYGYLSMAVAAIQVQSNEITALRQTIEGVRQEIDGLKTSVPSDTAPTGR